MAAMSLRLTARDLYAISSGAVFVGKLTPQTMVSIEVTSSCVSGIFRMAASSPTLRMTFGCEALRVKNRLIRSCSSMNVTCALKEEAIILENQSWVRASVLWLFLMQPFAADSFPQNLWIRL